MTETKIDEAESNIRQILANMKANQDYSQPVGSVRRRNYDLARQTLHCLLAYNAEERHIVIPRAGRPAFQFTQAFSEIRTRFLYVVKSVTINDRAYAEVYEDITRGKDETEFRLLDADWEVLDHRFASAPADNQILCITAEKRQVLVSFE